MLEFAKLFIGDVVTTGSDQAVMAAVVKHFERTKIRSIVLANANIGGRQLDCVALTERRAVVIEAKGYHRPVRGGPNGAWEVQLAGGRWKNIHSPYQQVQGARHALRDAIQEFVGREVPYPDAAIVFEPQIPLGSEWTTDFKVVVLGLDDLSVELAKQGKQDWSLEKLEEFARLHGLREMPDVSSACSPVIAQAHDLVTQYGDGFLRTYQPLTANLVSGTWKKGAESVTSDEVVDEIARGGAAHLLGPSGCGKSITAYRAAVQFAVIGVPLIVAAKNFSGSLKGMLDDEIQQIADTEARHVIAAAQRLNRPLLLLIDGFNECSEQQRSNLARRVAAFGRRYASAIVVTSQAPVSRSDLLPLDVFTVLLPSAELKAAIAKRGAGGMPLPERAAELLAVVSTCLEAELVGRLGMTVGAQASRFNLFDLFVRERLGPLAARGIAWLAEIAGWMAARVTFSISIRDVERLSGAPEPAATERLIALNVLAARGDRLSFGHDLYLDAYSAEAVLRSTRSNAKAITEALADPIHAKRKEFILGAIDDPVLLDQVLAGLADPELIGACLAGRCGKQAREWADAKTDWVFELMAAEVETVRLSLDAAGAWPVGFEPPGIAWAAEERAFVYAMPARVAAGHHLEKMLDLIGGLDMRLARERNRLREAAAARDIGLRSGAFSAAYVSQLSDTPALTVVSSRIHAGLVPWHSNEALGPTLLERLRQPDLSLGQVYFLLSLYRRNCTYGTAAALVIGDLIDRYWAGAPYHLKLDLMDSAGLCWRADDEERRALIHKIEALPSESHIFLSTSVVDALQHLGGLEESENQHEEVVRREIAVCLANSDDPDSQALAFSVYSACMDHPYSNAYAAVFNGLPAPERSTMLTMAARGAPDDSFFLAPLIVEVASLADKSAIATLARFLAPPATDSFNPSDAIQAFALAHLAYGQNGLALPSSKPGTSDTRIVSLRACGEVLYWMNRSDLSVAEQVERSAMARAQLEADGGPALNCLRLTERIYIEGWRQTAGLPPVTQSIANFVPADAVRLAKRALADPAALAGYFAHYHDHDRVADLEYAVGLIGRFGTTADIALLRQCVGVTKLGNEAIGAIRLIEERSAGTTAQS